MDFEWDEEKAEINRKKHDVDFEWAARVFLDPYRLEKHDDALGEDRWTTIGMVAPAVLVVVYTERGKAGEVIRLISARKANKYEQKIYFKVIT